MYANTTAVDGVSASFQVAQTDISISRDYFPPVVQEAAPVAPAVRIALLLPLRSEALGPAAEAVRAGFLAAYEREQDGMAVNVVETGDDAQAVLSSYADAVAGNDIVVGPLSRTEVTAVAQSGAVGKPTIALTQPEIADDMKLPPQLLVVGLSIEDEARQVAAWAGANRKPGKAFMISTNTAWQRRAAKAFATQWDKQGRELESIELSAFGGYLGARDLAELKKRFETDQPVLLFAALDEKQARQLRVAIGNGIPLYGTSQLNPLALPDWSTAEPASDMNGVRLLDIPWQLQADHPAVMIYPRPVANADQKRSADMERLYALGIDAYRVAREIALKRTSFELDGVTGKLKVRFNTAAPLFERIEPHAIYRDGSVMAVTDSR
jgi:outer membrane PBP1 activator LpoA protein